MTIARTLATARRVLQQLIHDHRSVAMILVMPSLILALFRWMYDGQVAAFERIGPQMLGLLPFVVMFLVTSISMVRERTSGTLERLLTTPLKRGELIGGYALAFGATALIQALISTAVAIWLLGLTIDQPLTLAVFAVVDAVLGTALGLLTSAFARTEFQAVQFMPVVVVPQILLGGLLLPRDKMPDVLHTISSALPLSFATDAFTRLSTAASFDDELGVDLAVLIGFIVAAVAFASLTLRRRSP